MNSGVGSSIPGGDDSVIAGDSSVPAGDGHGELFDWVTDFDGPVAAAVATRAPRRASMILVPRVLGGAAALVVAATLVTAALVPFEPQSQSLAGPTGTPQAPAPAPSAPAVAEPAPAVLPDIVPDGCDDLYGDDMMATFGAEGMELNTTWTGRREAPPGTADPGLRVMLEPKDSLDCFWLDAEGGADSAVLTSVAAVSEPEGALITDRLTELGFAHEDARSGTRFFVERTSAGETSGESHFLRDNLWFATNWYGFGPWGYTGHMVDQVF